MFVVSVPMNSSSTNLTLTACYFETYVLKTHIYKCLKIKENSVMGINTKSVYIHRIFSAENKLPLVNNHFWIKDTKSQFCTWFIKLYVIYTIVTGTYNCTKIIILKVLLTHYIMYFSDKVK